MGVNQGNTCQLCIGKSFVLQEVSSKPSPGEMGDTAGSEGRCAMAQEAGPLWSLPHASRILTNLETFTLQSHRDLAGNCSALHLNLNWCLLIQQMPPQRGFCQKFSMVSLPFLTLRHDPCVPPELFHISGPLQPCCRLTHTPYCCHTPCPKYSPRIFSAGSSHLFTGR